MGKQVIICETKGGEISTKARYIDSDTLATIQKCFRDGLSTILEIPETDIDKYPEDLFSELKPNPINKKPKSNEKSNLS